MPSIVLMLAFWVCDDHHTALEDGEKGRQCCREGGNERRIKGGRRGAYLA